MNIIIDEEEYLKLEDVLELTGLKQTNLYVKIKCKEFPKPEHMKIRALWKKVDIEKYIKTQKDIEEYIESQRK